MTYYIVNDETGQIIEQCDSNPEKYAQEMANECQCEVYVISGQHYGITCTPQLKLESPCDGRAPYNAEAEREAELARLAAWNRAMKGGE